MSIFMIPLYLHFMCNWICNLCPFLICLKSFRRSIHTYVKSSFGLCKHLLFWNWHISLLMQLFIFVLYLHECHCPCSKSIVWEIKQIVIGLIFLFINHYFISYFIISHFLLNWHLTLFYLINNWCCFNLFLLLSLLSL
jgi:hypothetical protein